MMKKPLDRMLVEQCAPVLAGIKTANLFRYAFSGGGATARHMVRRYSALLGQKGITLLILRECPAALLILAYRPALLIRDLQQPEAARLLRQQGYASPENLEATLSELCGRFAENKEFPHEIGLFLGYPPADVQGFIQHKGCNYHLCGCWKVYGNPEEARQKFRCYKKCQHVYRKHYNAGSSLWKLAVGNTLSHIQGVSL